MSQPGPTIAMLSQFARRARYLYPHYSFAEAMEGLALPDPFSTPENTTIDPADEAIFIQRVCDQSGDIDLAFDVGLSQHDPYNLPGYIARHSPTLREGIVAARKYVSTVRPGLEFSLDERGNIARLVLDVQDPALLNYPRYFELMFSGITAQIRSFTGRAIYPEVLSFTHHRDAIGAKLRARLGCRVEFGATGFEMLISHGALDAPFLSRDDILRQFLISEAERTLAEQSIPALSAAETVELLLERSFPERIPTLAETAREMGLSPRSLSRRLQAEETSFKEILGHVRLRIAARELCDTRASIGEIAHHLGYANQSAFATAFRRETGVSPRNFRKSRLTTLEAAG
ncbi:MAG: helix-turn-helix domain-containing protein [Pseudomonadota bacterium]